MAGFENTRSSDVKKVLEDIADGNTVLTTIHKPYSFTITHVQNIPETTRQFDICYSLDGLTVFVEAEMGRRIHDGNPAAIVTPEQKQEYELLKKAEGERLNGLTKKEGGVNIVPMQFAFEDYGLRFIEGPLVDRPGDKNLDTARAVSVLAQYDRIDLSPPSIRKAWTKFIDTIKKVYDVQTGLRCSGIREIVAAVGNDYHPYYHETDTGYRPKDTEEKVVFMKRISKEGDLKSAITQVYLAGLYVGSVLDDLKGKPNNMTYKLCEEHRKALPKVS
jgi:hypothetical protein